MNGDWQDLYCKFGGIESGSLMNTLLKKLPSTSAFSKSTTLIKGENTFIIEVSYTAYVSFVLNQCDYHKQLYNL